MHFIFAPRHFFASTLFFSAAVCVQAQTIVEEYAPGVTAEGITYFLPETHICFVLTATRRVHSPGEYAFFAERYLGINDEKKEKILKNIKISAPSDDIIEFNIDF